MITRETVKGKHRGAEVHIWRESSGLPSIGIEARPNADDEITWLEVEQAEELIRALERMIAALPERSDGHASRADCDDGAAE